VAERVEGAFWKMSRSASLPAGVKPIWIGWLGSDDADVDAEVVESVEDVLDELEQDECDAGLEPAMLGNVYMADATRNGDVLRS